MTHDERLYVKWFLDVYCRLPTENEPSRLSFMAGLSTGRADAAPNQETERRW